VYYGVSNSRRQPLKKRAANPPASGANPSLTSIGPGIYMPTLVSAVAVTVLGGSDLGLAFRVTGLLALLIWALGHVPRHARDQFSILDWDPDSLPKDWREQVKLWERFASVRPWAAMAAFALFS